MKLTKNIDRLIVGTVLLLSNSMVLAAKPQVETFTLRNGIRVISLYITDSKNVSIFTFFPMGLPNDRPG